jgi:hypothetical protein
MADHVVGMRSFLRNDSIKERFKIPFVIFALKILKPQKIDYIVSQADMSLQYTALQKFTSFFSTLG